MNTHFVNIDSSNIEFTSDFIKDIFIDYYTPITSKEHASYMANKFLSVDYLQGLPANGAVIKLLYLDDIPIGFIEYLDETDKVFLSKLYLHKDYRRQGYGKTLLNDVIDFTNEKHIKTIYLTCNKHNPTAQLYLHWGFRITDSIVTDIGNNYVMDDYIMELSIE